MRSPHRRSSIVAPAKSVVESASCPRADSPRRHSERMATFGKSLCLGMFSAVGPEEASLGSPGVAVNRPYNCGAPPRALSSPLFLAESTQAARSRAMDCVVRKPQLCCRLVEAARVQLPAADACIILSEDSETLGTSCCGLHKYLGKHPGRRPRRPCPDIAVSPSHRRNAPAARSRPERQAPVKRSVWFRTRSPRETWAQANLMMVIAGWWIGE